MPSPLLFDDRVDVSALAFAGDGPPGLRGVVRRSRADFRVDEDCPITPSGAGEHLWCRIEKTGITTPDAVQALSRAAGVHPRHIGYAGLKDRRAVATQWLSLAWPIKQALPSFAAMHGVRVLETVRHDRKLQRGAHAGNRFVIVVRELAGDDDIQRRAARIVADGVPNYFGAQRFGRDGANIALARAVFAGRRLSRNRRGYGLSAARSLVFNAVLDQRVRGGSWNQLLPGEAVMLAGSHSVFNERGSGQRAAALEIRRHAFDIHPSGPLPGRTTEALAGDRAAELEAAVLADYPDLVAGVIEAGVDAARRALRLPVPDLRVEQDHDTLTLRFTLPAGAFATSVLRELVATAEATDME